MKKRKQKNPTIEDSEMFTYIGDDIVVTLEDDKEIVFKTNTLKYNVSVSLKHEEPYHSDFTKDSYISYKDEKYSNPNKWEKLIDDKVKNITVFLDSHKKHRTMHPDSNEVAILFETENSNFIISIGSKGLKYSTAMSIFQLEDADSGFFEGRKKENISPDSTIKNTIKPIITSHRE
ncbi:hypothetical protein MHM95_05745 [Pseudoalteromonas sp. CnMc7-15]|uniref:hypothetical protein n=1 Tax=unclassified Pseudoalteromonas TaxID=194690 RepID=UPI001EF51CE2|nr:hypothetical protein [Pseudoalteromonas sp. CnMc7-15]MCG7565788.1 hypothetical protein [Pseudoalteromonas sp. CnMc7-15]